MNEYLNICTPQKCTGCMACLGSCTHNAIVLTDDCIGFKYPKIDISKCVNCGLCYSTCPVNHSTTKVFPNDCYAFQLKAIDQLETVASGGVGTYIAQYILTHKGVVYGCSGEDVKHVKHIRVDSLASLGKLKGSKYVQSDTSEIYPEIRQDILTGIPVLFIGTPCQVAGVRNYLRKPYPNLITVDLVCHGVPSQQLLNENIDYYRNDNIDLTSIQFRYKKSINTKFAKILYGWCFSTISTKPLLKTVKWYKDPYMKGFLECTTFRLCCYSCDYAYCIRNSDITISDFWGLDENAGINTGSGVSAVLINSEKGTDFWKHFSSTKQDAIIIKRKPQEAISGNGQLQCPSRQTPAVAKFRSLYPKLGLKDALTVVLRRRMIKVRLLLFIKTMYNSISSIFRT